MYSRVTVVISNMHIYRQLQCLTQKLMYKNIKAIKYNLISLHLHSNETSTAQLIFTILLQKVKKKA